MKRFSGQYRLISWTYHAVNGDYPVEHYSAVLYWDKYRTKKRNIYALISEQLLNEIIMSMDLL